MILLVAPLAGSPVTRLAECDPIISGLVQVSLVAGFSSNVWLGNGDGTFGNRQTSNQKPYNHGGF